MTSVEPNWWAGGGVRRALMAVSFLALLASGALGAQGRGEVAVSAPAEVPRDAAGHPDISGFWELRFDSRSVPPAALTEAALANANTERQHDLLALRFCSLMGMPGIMERGGTLNIRQGLKDIAIIDKAPSSVRYIYIDGRKHPAKDELDPVTNGNSIGTWDGDALVVDTVGFSDRGIVAVPGGGYRTPDSHLVERFHLLNGGATLSLTFTWEDPKVFQKPHTYEYRYYRANDAGTPAQWACAANNQDRGNFILSAMPAAAGAH